MTTNSLAGVSGNNCRTSWNAAFAWNLGNLSGFKNGSHCGFVFFKSCLCLCHCMCRCKRHPADRFASGIQILNRQPGVEAGTALPQAPDWPLATIQNLVILWPGMNPLGNAQFRAVGRLCDLAWHCIRLHTIKAAQLVAHSQVSSVGFILTRCK